MLFRSFCLLFLLVATSPTGFAQYNTTTRIDPSSKLYNKTTGQPLPYHEFEKLMRQDPAGYVFIPFYDEYGQLDYYSVRRNTQEERETNKINPFDEYEKPQVGKPVAPFIMKGIDDKVYDSRVLKGSYVLLSFWLKLDKRTVSPIITKDIQALQAKAAAKGLSLVSLGIVNYGTEEAYRIAMEELKVPFVPIPNSKGFVHRYALPNSPSFLLVGPDSKVLAVSELELAPLKLEKYLIKK